MKMKKVLLFAMAVLMSSVAASAQSETITITSEGVGPVKIGMNASQLPSSYAGLYDKLVEENSDMVLYSFYLNGETVMTTNGDGSIALIEVFPALQNVTTQDGVHPGMTAADFKGKSGWNKTGEETYEKDGVTVYLQFDEITNMQTGEYNEDW